MSTVVYTSIPGGGVGLVGTSGTPTLNAAINGIPADPQTSQLSAVLTGIGKGETVAEFGIYTSMPSAGVGLLGQNNTPGLIATVVGLETDTVSSDLIAVLTGVAPSQTTPDNIVYTSLGYGIGLIGSTTTPDLKASYSSAPEVGEVLFNAFYRAVNPGSGDLSSFIDAIAPLDLYAEVLGVTPFDLGATIDPIPPLLLSGTVTGISFLNLTASIEGFDEYDLSATVSGFYAEDLQAVLSGIGSDQHDLSAVVSGFKGINEEAALSGTIVGVGSGTLDVFANYVGHFPADLSGYYEAVAPVDLLATLQGSPSGVGLPATISGELPDGALQASISGSGGFKDLHSFIVPTQPDINLLTGYIDGTGVLDLEAIINASPQLGLNAVINEFASDDIKGLNAYIASIEQSSLSGSYSPVIGNELSANIEGDGSKLLSATITPKVFFIDSSIPINTYALKDLKAVINAAQCDFSSDYAELQVSISGTSADDLSASIIAIAGQYAMVEDEVEVLIKNNVITEDWVPLIIDQPAIIEEQLPIILTTAPFHNLTASITGIPNSKDLQANITPFYFAGVARDTASVIEWVNTKTGERRIVSIAFEGDAVNYYYSEDANDSFSFSPDDRMVISVQSYELDEDGEFSFLREKEDVKTCVVDDLQEFNTLDEAVRFAITCSLSQISSDLSAYISAKGQTSSLNAEVTALDSNLISGLPATINPVANQPELFASISGSGGFTDLSAYISPTIGAATGDVLTNELGERFIPKLVTHGTGEVSIVLTKVISTDTLNQSTAPDLTASITGVDELALGATVTGTI